MTILNLPRKQRYLQENVILIGIIPGPHEPKMINSLLRPLVDELCKLWTGVMLKNVHGAQVIIRAALICVACDVPAARKVCGFLSHNALHGCSKCLCKFPTINFGDRPDYCNFDRSQWGTRNRIEHIEQALKHKNCNTEAEQKAIEREFGLRYSALPYFDAPRMCIIDPMHNLFLGTAKHFIVIWKKLDLLSSEDFISIQQKVDSVVAPSDIGRTPSKITSGFSGFTAEQFKNWTIYFSLFALKNTLPWRHYNCWLLFVQSCFLLCRRCITQTQIDEADTLIIKFCNSFAELYGKDYCTPNIHLHNHLKDCIEDYGPVYAFWLFSYERLNGIMGSYHTNGKNISAQLFSRFLDYKDFAPFNWPTDFHDDFFPLLKQCQYNRGSLMQGTIEEAIPLLDTVKSLPPVFETSLIDDEIYMLTEMLHTVLHLPLSSINVLILYQQARAVMINNFIIGAVHSRYSKSSIVLVESLTPSNNTCLAEIQFFANINYTLATNSTTERIWVAAIQYFIPHPCKGWFCHPAEVWCKETSPGLFFIPLKHIKTRVVYTVSPVDFGRVIGVQTVMTIVPIVN